MANEVMTENIEKVEGRFVTLYSPSKHQIRVALVEEYVKRVNSFLCNGGYFDWLMMYASDSMNACYGFAYLSVEKMFQKTEQEVDIIIGDKWAW